MDNLKDKKILLCVTGSIAAFKACEFIRLLRKQGCSVKVVMSNSAQDFIGKLSLAALSDNEVLTESNQSGLEHVKFAIEFDAVVVLPATANILCKAGSGIADDINHEGITLLKNELTEYNFILGTSSFASLAFLYKESSLLDYIGYFNMTDSLNVSTINGLDVGYVFVRDPLGLHMSWHGEDLYIINNHFKCCGDRTIETDLLYECDADEKRYLEASDCTTNCSDDCFSTYDENYRRLLSSQLIQQHYTNTNKNVIFLGDLNDELTDNDSDNVFYDLISDPSFKFADMGIAEGLSDYWSYPSYPSHIDHILLTSNLIGSLDNPETSIFVPTVDLDFMNWEQYDFLVSDHRPVILNLAY